VLRRSVGATPMQTLDHQRIRKDRGAKVVAAAHRAALQRCLRYFGNPPSICARLNGRLLTLPPTALAWASCCSADGQSADLSRLDGGEGDCLSAARGRPAGPSEREQTSQSPSGPPSAVLLRRTGTRQGLPWRLACRGSGRACGMQFRDTAECNSALRGSVTCAPIEPPPAIWLATRRRWCEIKP
jgi:hypothetical protein